MTAPPALAALAARLLAGTGVNPADAEAVAAGEKPAHGTAADALRDGWRAAPPAPVPTPTNPGETP